MPALLALLVVLGPVVPMLPGGNFEPTRTPGGTPGVVAFELGPAQAAPFRERFEPGATGLARTIRILCIPTRAPQCWMVPDHGTHADIALTPGQAGQVAGHLPRPEGPSSMAPLMGFVAAEVACDGAGRPAACRMRLTFSDRDGVGAP